MPKLLVVAYHFPPDAAVGALRPQKFVKFLPEFGWEPHVLTIRKEFIKKRDEGRLDDVKHAAVNRTDFWRTPLQVYLDLRDQVRKPKAADDPSRPSSMDIPSRQRGSSPKESLRARLKRCIGAANHFPDDKSFWIFPAVVAGYRQIRRYDIRHILVTGPPHTVNLIGLLLSFLTGARLIVDWRDPWVRWRQPGELHWALLSRLGEFCEKAVVKRAHRVVTTTDRFRQALQQSYAEFPAEKFATIANGFDRDDLPEPEKAPRAIKFVIAYLGTFYLDRNPEAFLKALKLAVDAGEIPRDKIEVRFIGATGKTLGRPVETIIRDCGVEGIVTVSGPVPYKEALREMSEASLLLLLAPNQPLQIPAKAFEYLGAKRPILALTEEGATADLVREANAGLVVSQEDVPGILAALKAFFRAHAGGEASWYRGREVGCFERKHLVGTLAELLDS